MRLLLAFIFSVGGDQKALEAVFYLLFACFITILSFILFDGFFNVLFFFFDLLLFKFAYFIRLRHASPLDKGNAVWMVDD